MRTNFARSECAVTLNQYIRSDNVGTLIIPSTRGYARSALPPPSLSILSLFGGGIFLKRYWRWVLRESFSLKRETDEIQNADSNPISCIVHFPLDRPLPRGPILGIRLGLFPLGLRAPRCLGWGVLALPLCYLD